MSVQGIREEEEAVLVRLFFLTRGGELRVWKQLDLENGGYLANGVFLHR